MSEKKSNIMVAIANPDQSALPLLKKAAGIARQRNAALHLLHVIALPYGPVTRAGAPVQDAFKGTIRDGESRLAELVRTSQLRGLDVKTTVVWDYPASDAIVRQVMKHRPDLLVVESQRHGRLSRMVLTNTDWDLIRLCPCPLLLSKRPSLPARPKVVAALDPFHAHAKPAGLDDVILDRAVQLAGTVKRVTAFHSHASPEPLFVVGLHEPYVPMMTPEEIAAYEGKIDKKLRGTAARFDIPAANVIRMSGDPAQTLPAFVKRTRADLVVMGAVSRSGVKRLFIGNTAERLVDKLDCDILVVKPKRFASPVSRRPVALLPYPPYPL